MSAHSQSHHHGHGEGEVHPHIAPWTILLGILLILFIMTGLTVYTALEINLGVMGNTLLALAIAGFKAALVVGFFMHLHWDNKFNAVALLFCLLAIFTFMLFTVLDIGSRGMVDPVRAEMIPPRQVQDVLDRAIAEGRISPDGHGDAAHGDAAHGEAADHPAETAPPAPADDHGHDH